MELGNRYITKVILLGIIVVVAYRFYDYIGQRNFTLQVNSACDVATQSCFVSDDSSSDSSSTPDYSAAYEKVQITDKHAPLCLEEHTCQSFSCPAGLQDCSVTFCSKDTLDSGESCVGPLNNK